MIIREATFDDSAAVAALHAASWRHAYREALSEAYLRTDVEAERAQHWQAMLSAPSSNQHTLLAESEGSLKGFACFFGLESEQWGSYLNNIHVSQADQGSGIGALLLQAVASLCIQAYGEGGLYLWVLQSNLKAQSFYAKFGAINAESDLWSAPGGTEAPMFRFSWPSLRALQAAMASPMRVFSNSGMSLL